MNDKKNVMLTISIIIVFLIFLEILLIITYPFYSNYNTEMWRYAKEIKQINSNPKIVHDHKPNSESKLYGTKIKINSAGWRDKEYPLETENYRVMILGNSITLGWGIDIENTFSEVLEKKLEDVEVINAGVGNYNTEMEINSFLEKGKQYNPDTIILTYYLNNIEQTYKPSNKIMYLIKSTYSYSFLFDKIMKFRALNKQNQYENYYIDMYNSEYEGKIIAEESIKQLLDYCKSNNIDLYIVVIPEMHKFEDYPFQLVTDFVVSIGEEENIKVIDLLPYFKEYNPESLWVSSSDVHPNIKGHEIIAEGIYSEIFEKKG